MPEAGLKRQLISALNINEEINMKALVAKKLGPDAHLEIEERTIPAMKRGFTLVKMYAATVNPLSNLIRTGTLPLSKAPLVLSNDGSGVVVESDSFAKGAHVAIYGGGQLGITEDGLQQQWVLVENKRLVELPPDYSLEEAAALPINYVTAFQAMTRVGNVQKGDVVAITGATGSVGHALIQMANTLGAVPVAIISSSAKSEHAKKSGAAHIIDLSTQDLQQALLDITDGRGADIAFDQVGHGILGQLIRSVRPRGTVVSIGFIAGVEDNIDIPDLVIQEKKLLGYDAWMETDDDVANAMKSIQRFVAENKLKPAIDSIYAMHDFHKAYEKLTSRTAKGTVLLKLSDDQE